jgi:hypothetical protein
MPLRDHFRPPVTKQTSWDALHGGWPMVSVQHLNGILPPRYVAEPRVHLGALAEVDVAGFDHSSRGAQGAASAASIEEARSPGGETVRSTSEAWAPAAPTLTLETELADTDEYEVRVYDIEDIESARRLVAAVEIISPSNKDRSNHRAQFVSKCAALLRQQVSVVLVDLVTVRASNLYAELLDSIGERDPALGDESPPIYAVACRWRPRGASRWLEAWTRPLEIGQPLPTLPLWLSEELAVPLDLEASYEQACRDLRIA